MKELTLEDFNLTPAELARIVAGAQRHLPVQDENGEPANTTPDNDVDNDSETPTS